jgi:ubiquinone/menaquinone biosynthesis C-methylase UbiE
VTAPSINAEKVRAQQTMIWDGVSTAWEHWQPVFERGAATVTARLFDLSAISAGDCVLDIGSGTGEPALSAARLVGPQGRVVGVDLSPLMVQAARRAAAGQRNIEIIVGSAETAPLQPNSFDAALSRWGLMFAADRVELLAKIASALKPGGLLAAAVWSDPRNVPAISLLFGVISTALDLPPAAPGPGPFCMSNADEVTAELHRAGFVGVDIYEVMVPFRFISVEEFARFAFDVLPPGMKQLLRERTGAVYDPHLWNQFEVTASRYREPDGTISVPSSCLCLRAAAQ